MNDKLRERITQYVGEASTLFGPSVGVETFDTARANEIVDKIMGEILTIDDSNNNKVTATQVMDVTDVVQSTQETILTPTEEMIELVGGPGNGAFVHRSILPNIRYEVGIAVYRDEGFGKARYVQG